MRSTVLASRLVTTLSAQIALALSGFPILSAYATEPSQSEIQQQVSRARLAARVANDLGVRTFLKLQIVNSGQNSLLSPMSLAIACALIADGCNGLTRDKLARAIVSDGVLLADGNWKALRTLLLAKRNGVEQTLYSAS
jgi:serine protease inhibitor